MQKSIQPFIQQHFKERKIPSFAPPRCILYQAQLGNVSFPHKKSLHKIQLKMPIQGDRKYPLPYAKEG